MLIISLSCVKLMDTTHTSRWQSDLPDWSTALFREPPYYAVAPHCTRWLTPRYATRPHLRLTDRFSVAFLSMCDEYGVLVEWRWQGNTQVQTLPDLHSRYEPKGPAQVGTEYTSIHPCMALQPLPGLDLPQSVPPLVPVFRSSPPSSYS